MNNGNIKKRYRALKKWRHDLSQERNVQLYEIVLNRTLEEIAEGTFMTPKDLSSVWGMGPAKMQMYSQSIFDVLNKADGTFIGCTIFNDDKFNNMVNKSDVIYFDEYHPKRQGSNPKFDDISRRILNLKDMRPRAIDYYFKEINEIIDPKSSFVVCVLPSSEKGVELSGIRSIANRLSAQNNQVNGTGVLYRNKSMEKKHLGGPRDFDEEYKSITLQEANLIAGKQVLLLDDVTTTEMSLRVGKQLLLKGNANIVAMLALAKTSLDR